MRIKTEVIAGLTLLDCSPNASVDDLPAYRPTTQRPKAKVDPHPLRRFTPRALTKRLSSRFSGRWISALAAAGVPCCPACKARNHPEAVYCSLCKIPLGGRTHVRRRPRIVSPSIRARCQLSKPAPSRTTQQERLRRLAPRRVTRPVSSPLGLSTTLCALTACALLLLTISLVSPIVGQGLALCLM